MSIAIKTCPRCSERLVSQNALQCTNCSFKWHKCPKCYAAWIRGKDSCSSCNYNLFEDTELRNSYKSELVPELKVISIKDAEIIQLLAEKLSFNSQTIKQRISLSIEFPMQYYELNRSSMEERGITRKRYVDIVKKKELPLFALVDALIDEKYAYEIDWKEYVEEVCSVIEVLIKTKKYTSLNFEMVKKLADSNISTSQYLNKISAYMKEQSYSLGYIDIGSDSYVLILTSKEDFFEAKKLATKVGYILNDEFQ